MFVTEQAYIYLIRQSWLNMIAVALVGGTSALMLTIPQQTTPLGLRAYIDAHNPKNLTKVVLVNNLIQPTFNSGDMVGLEVKLINNGSIVGYDSGDDALNVTSPMTLVNNGNIRGAGGKGGNGGAGRKGADGAGIMRPIPSGAKLGVVTVRMPESGGQSVGPSCISVRLTGTNTFSGTTAGTVLPVYISIAGVSSGTLANNDTRTLNGVPADGGGTMSVTLHTYNLRADGGPFRKKIDVSYTASSVNGAMTMQFGGTGGAGGNSSNGGKGQSFLHQTPADLLGRPGAGGHAGLPGTGRCGYGATAPGSSGTVQGPGGDGGAWATVGTAGTSSPVGTAGGAPNPDVGDAITGSAFLIAGSVTGTVDGAII